jgi:hypothetical protein
MKLLTPLQQQQLRPPQLQHQFETTADASGVISIATKKEWLNVDTTCAERMTLK